MAKKKPVQHPAFVPRITGKIATTAKGEYMSFFRWMEEFRPIYHPLAGCGIGSEMKDGTLVQGMSCWDEEIRQWMSTIPGEHVWTAVESGTSTELVIVPGYHLVNREAYYVTERPWTEFGCGYVR